jgi:hypothetical protein
MSKEKRGSLLSKCCSKLSRNGIIILRDADKDLHKKHRLTQYTEFFSTNFRFNKKTEKLDFFSSSEIYGTAPRLGLSVELLSRNDRNSNVIYLLRKNSAVN